MTMRAAYAKAQALAVTTQEPAVVIRREPNEFDALTAEDYRNAPELGEFFDTLTAEED